jgi:acyl carrier protein
VTAEATTEATLDVVCALVRDTLGLPGDADVRAEQLLFYDLAFTSLDLLDLLYRLEERFAIAIPEGTLYRLARGELDDAAVADTGHLTALGRDRLIALLHDSPPAIFPDRIHVQTLPRYCTVAALARLVDHQVAQRCSS